MSFSEDRMTTKAITTPKSGPSDPAGSEGKNFSLLYQYSLRKLFLQKYYLVTVKRSKMHRITSCLSLGKIQFEMFKNFLKLKRILLDANLDIKKVCSVRSPRQILEFFYFSSFPTMSCRILPALDFARNRQKMSKYRKTRLNVMV